MSLADPHKSSLRSVFISSSPDGVDEDWWCVVEHWLWYGKDSEDEMHSSCLLKCLNQSRVECLEREWCGECDGAVSDGSAEDDDSCENGIKEAVVHVVNNRARQCLYHLYSVCIVLRSAFSKDFSGTDAISKRMNDIVIGGTVNKNGILHVRVTEVFRSEGALSQIVQLVESAQMAKAPLQKFADCISKIQRGGYHKSCCSSSNVGCASNGKGKQRQHLRYSCRVQE